ncbi:hypothetical protein AB0E69_18610 [Kribbella sp. NPDC026611]|uniref:hypothetical protein n=1 Tax=Kribbella sp. NPDC026611 TaxID=3154911 RepID=UPI0033EC2D4C
MAGGRLLDPSSDDYRRVAGLIRSAHRAVGATQTQWWNGQIALLRTLSSTRSRVDLDGTIHVHPRHVLGALREHDLSASRAASYDVVREALRMAGPTGLTSRPNQPLDQALPANYGGLDRALAEQRAQEITAAVMAENGLPHLTTSTEVTSTAYAAAARGLVDRLTEACDRPREEVFDEVLRSEKTNRWVSAIVMVAEAQRPGLLDAMKLHGRDLNLMEEHRAAGRQWARLGTPPGREDLTATSRGYEIGRDTGGLLAGAGRAAGIVASAGLDLNPRPEPRSAASATRELTPDELLGPQVSPTGTPTTTSTAPAVRPTPERPEHQTGK